MEQIQNSKRIAKNTIFLYVRMFIVMGISFYTSRIILDALGVVDFGIYNVVGGISSSFIFFSASLTNSVQRFLNIELGKSSIVQVKNIFNLSLFIYSLIALFVIIIGIIVGNWFIEYKLVIPANRYEAAYIVLYTMLLSLGITFVTSVFESVLIARENMRLYAYLGIVDAVAKLCIAYCIVHVNTQKLVLYAILMAGIQVIIKFILTVYCIRIYPECKFKFYWDNKLFKEMLIFSGWNIYGSGVWMINEQGINTLLNIFFGPVVNAARGIAVQVNNAINNFSTNFFVAVRPQIIKSYAIGDYNYLRKLVFASSRFSVYLLWLLCLPIILRTKYILSIWLKEVPDYAVLFVQWILIYSIVNSLNNPLWSVVMATGKLKKTVLIGSNIFLMAFPLSFLFLKMGYPPEAVYPILIIMRIIFLIVTISIIGKMVKISFKNYNKKVLLPIIISTVPIGIIMLFVNSLFKEDFSSLVIICCVSTVLSLLLIYYCGISRDERIFIINKIKVLRNKWE